MIFYGIVALIVIGLAIAFVIDDKKKKCCHDGKETFCNIECNPNEK